MTGAIQPLIYACVYSIGTLLYIHLQEEYKVSKNVILDQDLSFNWYPQPYIKIRS